MKKKAKAGRKRSAVKDLAAKKSVKGGLLPAVRPSNLSVPAVQLPAVQLAAVQRTADGSV
jgi:hypothetical protein